MQMDPKLSAGSAAHDGAEPDAPPADVAAEAAADAAADAAAADAMRAAHGAAPEDDHEDDQGRRDVGPALLRGWNRACPRCGGGPVFDGFLTVRDRCMVCGEELHHHRADDMPAWITILVVGHVTVPLLLAVNEYWDPEMWVHMVIWPIFVLAASLLLLPRAKAMVVALQWATRMGGFGKEEDGTREGT